VYIPVVLKGGKEELVSKDELQFLMASQKVLFFKRSDGWAVIGCDKMRDHQTPSKENDRREHDVYTTEY
jgi:hypothetical protein